MSRFKCQVLVRGKHNKKRKDEEENTCAVRVVLSTAYRVLDEVNHGKVPACFESVTFQVSRATSIIREMECPRIRM